MQRRTFLASGCAIAVRAAPAFSSEDEAGTAPWSSGTARPKFSAPLGTTDCHHHIFDSRFPRAAGVRSSHPDATALDYLKLAKRIRITRHVVVQPSTYGVDNSCLLDALNLFGANARGIAVVNTEVTKYDLQKLHDAGVRGLRFNFAPAGVTTPEMIIPLSRRVAEFGWNVQLHASADEIVALSEMLGQLSCPLVLDHLARIPPAYGENHPAYSLTRNWIDAGKTWVKLSSFYAESKLGGPAYSDIGAIARAFIAAAPERVIWGTGWPHTPEPLDRKPNDATSFDLLETWIPDEAKRRRVLVDNPARLFGF